MAPVDEKIAQARLERKKSMTGSYDPTANALNQQETIGGIAGCDTAAYRPPTLAEQAEKNAAFHLTEHIKNQNAAYFLSAHPEFDEFIRLVRSGAVQFIVFALFAVAAFAQEPQPPAQPPPPPAASSPAPTLSAAEKTALQALEKQKQDAQSQFSQAQQAEAVIEREFITAHSGFHINPQTFVVEENSTPATAGAPAKAPPALLHRPSTAPPAK
jgi:hypothetical protein